MNTKKTVSRRDFIRRTAAGAGMLALSPANSLLARPAKGFWPKNAKKYTIYMIGHAHVDLVWLWPWTEGLAFVHSTFRSALERMKETPDLVFTCSSALFYRWVSENDPEMLDEIRSRVAEGRWNVVGGWWTEPDMNIPSGEAMARQGLYGQRTLRKLTGRQATVAFSADSFGHAGTVPQIIRLQGMENYVFMRPGGGEKDLPSNLFWWEGPDGSSVLAYRIHHHYGSLDQGEALTTRDDLRQVAEYVPQHPVPMVMKFFGVGDHGGGPSKAHIRVINEARAEKDAPVIRYDSADRYFEDVRRQPDLRLPVVRDDLQHHAPGCYTADSAIKKNNRLAEAALVAAEKISAIGSVCWKNGYPKDAFTQAWERVMMLQFHDSMAGTSLVSHYQYARHGYGYALNVAEDATAMAVQKLEWQVAAEDPKSNYLLVFNPHAWEFKGLVRYDSDRNTIRITDEQGHTFPHQWITGQAQTHGRHTLLIDVTVPSMGYVQLRAQHDDSPAELPNPARAEDHVLENEYYRITFSAAGAIGVFDKQSGKQVFSGGETGCRAIVIDDPSDTWSHDIKAFDREIGTFAGAGVKPLYSGPLRATMRVTATYGRSTLTVDWSLVAGSNRIEAEVKLDWQERLKMLKFSFPVDVDAPVPTYEAPYGFIVRAANGDEDPGQRWVDVSGQRDGKTCGLTVINDAKYGYSVKDNDLRVSVVRSAVYAHHQPKELRPEQEYEWMDQGLQTFRMWLVPHGADWQENHIPRIAEEFITSPVVIYQGIHPGILPKSGSFMEIDAPDVLVTAIKQSEDGDDLIVRLVETVGRETSATFRFPPAGIAWRGTFRPCEIKTLRLSAGAGTATEVNLLEE
jgi:alpha-mannosidase